MAVNPCTVGVDEYLGASLFSPPHLDIRFPSLSSILILAPSSETQNNAERNEDELYIENISDYYSPHIFLILCYNAE